MSSGANRMTPTVARRAEIPMLAISQKPERVSNILRSSTPVIRVSGIGAADRSRGADGAGCDGGHATAASGLVAEGLLVGWRR